MKAYTITRKGHVHYHGCISTRSQKWRDLQFDRMHHIVLHEEGLRRVLREASVVLAVVNHPKSG